MRYSYSFKCDTGATYRVLGSTSQLLCYTSGLNTPLYKGACGWHRMTKGPHTVTEKTSKTGAHNKWTVIQVAARSVAPTLYVLIHWSIPYPLPPFRKTRQHTHTHLMNTESHACQRCLERLGAAWSLYYTPPILVSFEKSGYSPGLLPGRWPGPACALLKVKTPSSAVTTGTRLNRQAGVSTLFACVTGVHCSHKAPGSEMAEKSEVGRRSVST